MKIYQVKTSKQLLLKVLLIKTKFLVVEILSVLLWKILKQKIKGHNQDKLFLQSINNIDLHHISDLYLL